MKLRHIVNKPMVDIEWSHEEVQFIKNKLRKEAKKQKYRLDKQKKEITNERYTTYHIEMI